MTEPTIICPDCKTEIKLTEALAAPQLASTRLAFAKQIAQKDSDMAARDMALRGQEKRYRMQNAIWTPTWLTPWPAR